MYKKIPIDLIDANPYQARDSYDEDVAAGIALSALGRHGILQPPMVRVKDDGRFETVFGHGRIRAAKAAGFKELECRVENNVTDAEMKRYMGQENVLRSDFTESERMAWLEQVREDLGLELDDPELYTSLYEATNVSRTTIESSYFVNKVRKRLISSRSGTDAVSANLIHRTRGLVDADQDKLILKTAKKGWSGNIAYKIKTAIKDIDPELRARLLHEEVDLPWKVIVDLAELEFPENALKFIEYIATRRITEKGSLMIIEDAKQGIYPTYNVKYSNKLEEVMKEFRDANIAVAGWGPKKYEQIKDHWDVIEPILTNIENKIQAFRRLNRVIKT